VDDPQRHSAFLRMSDAPVRHSVDADIGSVVAIELPVSNASEVADRRGCVDENAAGPDGIPMAAAAADPAVSPHNGADGRTAVDLARDASRKGALLTCGGGEGHAVTALPGEGSSPSRLGCDPATRPGGLNGVRAYGVCSRAGPCPQTYPASARGTEARIEGAVGTLIGERRTSARRSTTLPGSC